MNTPYTLPEEQQPFNVWDAIVGVIVRPVVTMQKIAAARPWIIALVIMGIMTIVSTLTTLTTPRQPLPPNSADMPPAFLTYLTILQSPSTYIVLGLLSPLIQFLYFGLLYLSARLLGGTGPFSALFSTLVFAGIISLFIVPITLLANLSGAVALSIIGGGVSFLFSLWVIVLQIIGIRESMRISTGRAVATWLIPFAILMFFICGATVLITTLTLLGTRTAP